MHFVNKIVSSVLDLLGQMFKWVLVLTLLHKWVVGCKHRQREILTWILRIIKLSFKFVLCPELEMTNAAWEQRGNEHLCISHLTTATAVHMLVQELFLKSNSCSWGCQKELVAEWEKNNFCPLEDDGKRKLFSLLSSDHSRGLPIDSHACLQHPGKHFFPTVLTFL